MANSPLPKINTAYILYVGLYQQADTRLLKANPTLASGDFKVSIDGGAFANLATLPTVTPASGTAVKISLSAGEMNGDNIFVTCIDAAGAEWCDLPINIQTATRGVDDLAFPATSGRSMVVDAAGLVDANVVKLGPTGSGTAQTARDIGLSVLLAANQHVIVDSGTVTTVTNQLTAAAIATGIWQDTTAGDFTTALSVGKSVMNGVSLGTGLTVARCTLTDTLTTYTGNTVQTGDSYARIGAAGISLSAIPDLAGVTTLLSRLSAARAGYLDNINNANLLSVPSAPAAVGSAMTLTSAYDFAKGTVAVTESYAADGSAPTPIQALLLIQQALTEFAISGTTMTIKKVDGSTTAATETLDSATTPTSITRAS